MKQLILAAASALSIAACTNQVTTPDGAVSAESLFSQSQLTALLAGKSYPLSKGALYFDPSGTLSAVWDGKTEDGGSWRVTDQSEFCYNLKMFGVEECLGLTKNASGQLVQDYEGSKQVIEMSDLKDGKAF